MSSQLCQSSLYANQVLCEVISNLDNFLVLANEMKTQALADVEALRVSSTDAVDEITAVGYNPDTSSVPVTHTPASNVSDPDAVPAAYGLPSATSRLISDATIEDIFDRTAARLASVGAREERDAIYQAAAMGLGMPSAALLTRLDAAQERTSDKQSDAALEQGIQEGVWLREDAKTLHNLHIQNWPLRVQAETARFTALIERMRANITDEAERRGWSELQMRSVLNQAETEADFQIKKVSLVMETAQQAQEAVAQLMVGLTQALYSAAHYGLSGTGSQSVSEAV